jgi:hypothetical protein
LEHALGRESICHFWQVKNGNYLERAKEIKLDTFVTVWLENTPFKVDMNLNELYSDTLFTYFGKQTFKSQDLIKIKSNELRKIDYKLLNGDSIRTSFYNEINFNRGERKKGDGKNCTSTSIKIDYEYKLIESENIIEVRSHYKLTCEFMIGLIKADYFAKHGLRNRTFIKS